MFGQFDLVTLIALIVAVVAIVKLRSVLGQRTDEDEQRVERIKTREREAGASAPADAGSADVITLPRGDRDGLPQALRVEANSKTTEAKIRAFPVVDPSITDGLLAIGKVDADFDPDAFLVGAGRAYEMIISAFAGGDRGALKSLLSDDVYTSFVSAIAAREARREVVDQTFVGIKKADIVEAEAKDGSAFVTVRFVSELISATLDKSGEVVAGDPQKIKDVTDIWTFSRDISTARARDNINWKLDATQAPN